MKQKKNSLEINPKISLTKDILQISKVNQDNNHKPSLGKNIKKLLVNKGLIPKILSINKRRINYHNLKYAAQRLYRYKKSINKLGKEK